MKYCPRCASETGSTLDNSRFCWMCGWDTHKLYMECDRCSGEVGDDGYCLICNALIFAEDEDEEER